MPEAEKWHILPQHLLELQIGQIDLLMAMYPSADEVVITDESRGLLESLRRRCEEHSTAPVGAAPSISLLLRLDVSETGDDDSAQRKTLELDLTVPFYYEETATPPEESPQVKVRIRQPSWLNRSSTAQLASEIPPDEEDLLSTIEHIKQAAALQQHRQQLATAQQSASNNGTSDDAVGNGSEPLVRVWFYFPSISTRSKRDDLITNAPSYGLTGFLYAGKPGILCVEGGSQRIDEYMRFIKTESWGDIPAQHKKVSERYRESGGGGGGCERVFVDMQEITDLVGERRGKRVNRGDMKALEAWLVEKGLGDAFAKVLI